MVDIPAKILKESMGIYLKEITFIINDCIENGIFLMILNWLMYHLDLKKKIVLKEKIIQRLAYYHSWQKTLKGSFINKSIPSWLQKFLLIYAQYSLLKMIETWKKTFGRKNRGNIYGPVKGFYTINRSLLWQKLDAYSFSRGYLKIMQSYLCSRQSL